MDCEDKQNQKNVRSCSATTAVNSNFGAGCLFATSFLSFLTVGFVYTYTSPIISVLHYMYNTTHMSRYGDPISENTWIVYLTLTTSFIILGGVVAGATTKYWLMILSRKHLLQLCHVINILSVLVMALVGGLTWSWEVMIIGRFLSGFPAGVEFSLVPIMIAEMCAKNKQGVWQSSSGVGLSLGSLLGTTFAHPKILGTIQLWPVLISLAAIPSVIYLIVSFWIPETPFYLFRKCGRDEALLVLKKLRVEDENSLDDELSEMRNEMKEKPIIGIKEMITTKQYRNQLIAVFAIYANHALVGINNVLFYADYIVQQAGVSSEASGFVTIGIFTACFGASLVGSYFINRFGGLKVNIASNINAILAHTLFTITQAIRHLAPTVMPILSVVAIAIFTVGWFGGTIPGTLSLLGQLTIEPTRPTAFQYGYVILCVLAWFVGFIAPYLDIYLGPYSLTIWLGCAIFFLIYQVIFLPDPQGKTVEEIQAKFK